MVLLRNKLEASCWCLIYGAYLVIGTVIYNKWLEHYGIKGVVLRTVTQDGQSVKRVI